MSDTPRTDALNCELHNPRIIVDRYSEMMEHAQKLERELTEAREQRDGAFSLIDYAGELLGVPKQEHKSAHGFKILQAIAKSAGTDASEKTL